jgi:ubiquinone biosynthesis protein
VSGPTVRERVNERLRLLQIYEIFLRYGSDTALDHGLAGDARRALQGWFYGVSVEPLTAPEKTRLMLQELGPTYVKLGQIISSRADTLPADWEAELTRLQSRVRPVPVEQARAVITAELGAPPEELYESFDPRPLAAASLAQVHRATLPGGRPAVVKVQRPNIEPRMRADLLILARAARVAERRSATAAQSGLADVVEEFGSARAGLPARGVQRPAAGPRPRRPARRGDPRDHSRAVPAAGPDRGVHPRCGGQRPGRDPRRWP